MNRISRIDICETCGGEGTVIEFRRFAGEYQAGEPYEVPCPDCDGEDDDEPGVPFDYGKLIRDEYALRERIEADLRFTMEMQPIARKGVR